MEAFGQRVQKSVPCGMAERVVDVPEVVEIAHKDGDPPAGAPRAGDRLDPSVLEEGAVWESGQRIVECELAQFGLESRTFGRVVDGDHDALDVRVVEQVDHDDLCMAFAAVSVEQTRTNPHGTSISRPELLPQCPGGCVALFGVEVRDELSRRPPGRVGTEHPGRGRRGVDDRPSAAHHEHDVGSVLYE